MKTFLQFFAIACMALGTVQNAKAQTTLYETTFPNAASVNTWTLTNGAAWANSYGGASGGGSLKFASNATATMPTLAAGYKNMNIEVTTIYGTYISYQTSINGTTWTSSYSLTGYDATTTTKSLPDGTRYIKFIATYSGCYIQSVKVISATPNEKVTIAKNLVESTYYPSVSLNIINTKAEAKQKVQSIINGLNLNGITPTIVQDTFLATTSSVNGFYKFKVELSLTSAITQTTKELGMIITIPTPTERVTAAKDTIEKTVFPTVNSNIVGTQAAAKQKAQQIIGALNLGDVATNIVAESFQAATSSANGFYKFQVDLSCSGAATQTTIDLSMTILPTAEELITAAKSLVENTYFLPIVKSDINAQDTVKKRVMEKLAALGLNGVTATLVQESFLAATATDGYYKFKVELSYTGVATQTTKELSLTIINPTLTGTGTSASPYLINTAADLAHMAALVNTNMAAYTSAYYKLNQDIDLAAYGANYNDGKGWIPIGNNSSTFRGNFDGNNKIISNLYINNTISNNSNGLFGNVVSAKISNLGLSNVNIKGYIYTGSIFGYAGYSDAGNIVSITNCYAEGSVSGNTYVGGLGGSLGGDLDNKTTPTPSIITKSYFIGSVIGTGSYLGGILGYCDEANISLCYTHGSVIGTYSYTYAGGIVGRNNYGKITNSYSISTVSGGSYVGGIAGYTFGSTTTWGSTVANCAALNPNVKGTGTNVGRVTGDVGSGHTISNNVAYSGVKNNAGNNTWAAKTATGIDGADLVFASITTDIGSRFTAANGFTIGANVYPGFKTTYPRLDYTALLTTDSALSALKIKIETSGFASTNASTMEEAGQQAETIIAAWNTAGIMVDIQDENFKLKSGDTTGFYTFKAKLSKGAITQLTKEVGFLIGSNLSITGMGVSASPYIISSAKDLAWLAYVINDYNSYFYYAAYKLGANIDLSAYGKTYNNGQGWTPIRYFYGTFDGDGKTISNLYINNSEFSYVGLFGRVYDATIKNLGVAKAEVVSSYAGSNGYTGGLAGEVGTGSIITRCYVSGSVSGAGENTGGLIGRSTAYTLSNCYTTGLVQGAGNNVGGLLGYNLGRVANCYSVSSVYNTTNGYNGIAAGLVGGYTSSTTASVSNSAALNPVVKSDISRYVCRVVAGSGSFANNAGLTEMLGSGTWSSGATGVDGLDMTLATITAADGTIGGRMTIATGWATPVNGKLPSLFGEEVLISQIIAAQDIEKVKTLIEDTTFSNETILTASTPSAAKSCIQSQLAGLAVNGVTATVTDVNFTAANAENGTNGSYTFTVEISKAPAYSLVTKEITIEIQIVKLAQGNGTAQNPYLIRTKDELTLLSTLTNSGVATAGAHYKQMANINLQNKAWDSISPFEGTYDGNGFYIDSLKSPLFGTLKNATLNRVGVNSGTISGQAAIALLLTDTGYITGCWNKADVEQPYYTSSNHRTCGGIVSNIQSGAGVWIISECRNAGSIRGKENYNKAGGIAGSIESNTVLRDCYNTGGVYVSQAGTSTYIGGIVGYAYGLTTPISNCYNTGTVSSYPSSTGRQGFIGGNCYGGTDAVTATCFYDGTKLTTLPYADDTRFRANGTARTEGEFKAPNTTVVNLLNGTPSSYMWTQDAAINNGYPIINYGTVTLSFNTKGGLPIADTTLLQKDKFELLPTPKREGYAFEGWYLDENYASKAMPTAGLGSANTVYARWKTQTVFVVKTGSAIAPKDFFADSAYLCTVNTGLPTPTRGSYVFKGWINKAKTFITNSDIAGAPDTLYAVWQVKIKFNTDGGDALDPETYYSELTFDENPNTGLPVPTKEGYVFGSWYGDLILDNLRTNSDEVPLKRQDTMYALWGEPITVTFEPNNGDAATTKTYYPLRNYNTSITWEGVTYNNGFIPQPTHPDGLFAGWFDANLTEQAIATNPVPNYDHTLSAKWTLKQTVSFETNGGTTNFTSKEYYPGYTYSNSGATNSTNTGLPTNPTQENAAFLGWYTTSDFSDYSATTASDLVSPLVTTLYAKWSKKTTVSFVTSGGTEIAPRDYYFDYAYNRSGISVNSVNVNNPGLPADPIHANFAFLGWYDNQNFEGSPITASSTVNPSTSTLYAKWSTKNNISFITEGGTEIPARDYYFDYTYNSYFSVNGASTNNGGLPSDPTRANSAFLGWYDNPSFEGSQITNTSKVSQSTSTLYAKWSTKTTVNFVTSGGTEIAPKDYYFGYAYSSSYFSVNGTNTYNSGLPSTPKRENSAFLDWYDNSNFEGSPIMASSVVSQSTTTLYAKWSEKIIVNFVTDGGTEIAARDYYFDYAYNRTGISVNGTNTYNGGLPSNPTKANAYFMGWYDNSNFTGLPITASNTVSQSTTTLYAKWSEQITITFESNDGSTVADKKYYPGYNFSNGTPNNPSLPTPNPTKDSAFFVGWYATSDFSGEQIANYTVVTNEMTTLYARWAEKTWVTFIDYEEDTMQRKAFYHSLMYGGTPNTNLPNAIPVTKPGFLGWYNRIAGMQDKVTDTNPVPDGNVTLHARWCVKVAFNVNGGTPIDTAIYTPNLRYNQSPNEGLPTAFRANHGFEGWYADAGLTKPITAAAIVPDSAHTLYAKWKAPTMVTVSFNTNGGTAIANKTYQADGLKYGQTPNTGLPATTKTGRFVFDTWCKDSLLTQRVTDTSLVQDVSHRLHARWTEIPLPKYTITITSATHGAIVVKNGTTTVTTGAKLDSLTTLTLQATPNAGYKFVKWWDNNTNANRTIVLKSDTTIFAIFEAIPYTAPKYTVTLTQPSNGTFTVKNGETIVSSGDQIDSATVLTLQASPNAGYKFSKWWDNDTTINRTVVLKSNLNISATFEAIQGFVPVPKYTVTITQPVNGSISVKNGSFNVTSGTQLDSATTLTLTATPNANYKFQKWWDNDTNAVRSYTLKQNVTISCTFSESSTGDTTTPPSAIEDLVEKDVLTVYPNPVNDVLNIQTSQIIKQTMILDMQGKVWLNVQDNRKTLNLQRIPQGNYILRIYTGTAILTAKIVKQ